MDSVFPVAGSQCPAVGASPSTSSFEKMASFSIWVVMAIFFLVSLAAMLLNGFMVTVLGREWARCGLLQAGDMIVACLAASRFCLHAVSILNNFLSLFDFYRKTIFYGSLWDFFNTLTFWLTVWLAAFYCVKISTFTHPALLWLKCRISLLVPRLLLSSLLISVLSAVSSFTEKKIIKQSVFSQSSPGNRTAFQVTYTFLVHQLLMWFPPFVLFLVSITLLMFSLCRHVGRLRDRMPGLRDPSTKAHATALKSLAFFLVVYVVYLVFLLASSARIAVFQAHWYWAREMILYADLFLHSVFLMLGNSKTRKALGR
ncbi:taste receptor type 2 member 143-like [Ctenodactylus gundi]